MIEAALVNTLRGKAGVGSRIYPLKIPQGVNTACIVYQRIYTKRYYTFEGESDQVTPKFQIDCYSAIDGTYGEAKNIAQAVIGMLSGYTGTLTDGNTYTTHAGILTTNELDAHEAGAGTDSGRYRVIIDVDITHSR